MSMAVGDRALTWEERFWRRVAKTNYGCWTWLGGKGGAYGVYMLPGQRRRGAHVIAFELANGPLSEGMVIDHLCCEPLCVNPAHLEAVTPSENRRRQVERQSHCRKGHELSGTNLYQHSGKRYCRTCRRDAQRRYVERVS